jgi:hypothetical protein
MRKYACCYAQGKYGARHFRANVANVTTPEEFYQVVEQYFPREKADAADTGHGEL